ncbi:hypothetical protein ACN258_003275 [Vibrio cholerae]|uniref:hypothetical protein n=1 Tax=Vibrio TaxID=662 RepID=UPI000ABC737C|nr:MULTISPECIES: hypothetical protein [Vibrio]GHW17256.1 alkaline serine exoprotease A precursor [Vibrio cholerae]GHW60224.1 alkaline serine exoprotease A precursor [Vibrio cholerae]GHX42405.1 alkaline serine exoprotease A precursor [Vibrio cholerae]GHY31470.1 alkaline serine exoprotease A precursor [Vibrio cholerae]GIB39114.1 alkaline serine exoprotease A precursor [Vibrio cholerae]
MNNFISSKDEIVIGVLNMIVVSHDPTIFIHFLRTLIMFKKVFKLMYCFDVFRRSNLSNCPTQSAYWQTISSTISTIDESRFRERH